MTGPFLGCAYYPEDWGEDQIPFDISKMQEAGIKCARIGEFAWRKMEPKPGEFDFKWLHHVVDSLAEAGITVVMGTPTATPPVWLGKAHPDIFMADANGIRKNHGGRRHACDENPYYLEASDRIVEAMGREFGTDKNIIGWQIDNEIYAGQKCTCEYCMKAYHKRLEREYGTVEKLNARWNLNLFSQAYDEFDEVPADTNAWHNPHLKYEWAMSHYDSDIRFVHRQAEILKKYTKAPIGTDMMPINGMGYEDMNGKLDIVQFNHYNVPENLSTLPFWFNYLRNIKDRPFWNTETATTWNGSTAIGQFLKPEGYCHVNSWLPVALGGEANMYWLFRQHWAGHELVHGSVITPEGRNVHAFKEIQQTAADFEKAGALLSGTKVKTEVAIHFVSRSWNLFEQQKLFNDNDYRSYLPEFHTALLESGLCPDVIGADKPLDKYRLVFSPMVMTTELPGFREKIKAFVENGGTWVAGPMTDIRNDIGAHYIDRAMGMLEEMLDIRQDYQIPSDGTVLKAAWTDGSKMNAGPWVEAYTVPEKAKKLAVITGGHSAIEGETVIAEIPYGKGKVILLGAKLSGEELLKLVDISVKSAGVTPFRTEGMLTVVKRQGEAGECLVVCETEFKPGKLYVDAPVKDILTDRIYEDCVEVPPYGVMVLQKA